MFDSLHRHVVSFGSPSSRMRILLCLLLLALSACTGINLETQFQPDPSLRAQIIDQQEDRFASIDPLHIGADIKALVDRELAGLNNEADRVAKLQDILYGEDYLNLQYSDEQTHTAHEAFLAREGNCLSAMNLYVAMARYAGLDARFQTVRVQPSWDRRGDVLVLSQHINATGRFNVQRRYVVDFTPEIALQQLTSAIITDAQARALYFNNLGVEALVAGDEELALTYYKNALFLDDQLSIAWNNIGATYNRLGESDLAEYSYQMAFHTDGRNSSAINNLAKFYRNQGLLGIARQYENAIARFNERNPYYHYALGNLAFSQSEYDAARLMYRRAIRLKEVEPDFHYALARVYDAMGYSAQASEARNSAAVLLAENAEIYRPSNQKMRIIDNATILRDSSPGLSINLAD